MKLKSLAALALSAVLLLSGCAAPAQNETTPESSSAAPETTAVSERVITDSYGNKTELPDDPCVVSLYGSFAECWLLSGGKLAGITEDAVDEHGIEIDDDTALVGTVMEPNLESVAALSPDYGFYPPTCPPTRSSMLPSPICRFPTAIFTWITSWIMQRSC